MLADCVCLKTHLFITVLRRRVKIRPWVVFPTLNLVVTLRLLSSPFIIHSSWQFRLKSMRISTLKLAYNAVEENARLFALAIEISGGSYKYRKYCVENKNTLQEVWFKIPFYWSTLFKFPGLKVRMRIYMYIFFSPFIEPNVGVLFHIIGTIVWSIDLFGLKNLRRP